MYYYSEQREPQIMYIHKYICVHIGEYALLQGKHIIIMSVCRARELAKIPNRWLFNLPVFVLSCASLSSSGIPSMPKISTSMLSRPGMAFGTVDTVSLWTYMCTCSCANTEIIIEKKEHTPTFNTYHAKKIIPSPPIHTYMYT